MVAPEDQQVLARRRVPTRQIIIHAAFAHVHAVERTRSGGSRCFGSLVRTYSSMYAFFCGVPPVKSLVSSQVRSRSTSCDWRKKRGRLQRNSSDVSPEIAECGWTKSGGSSSRPQDTHWSACVWRTTMRAGAKHIAVRQKSVVARRPDLLENHCTCPAE